MSDLCPFKIPESVLVVIHTPLRSVLLIRRANADEYWQSVTGSKDEVGEDFAATAVRAVFEQDLKPDVKLERMAEQHALVVMKNFPGSKVGVQGLEKSLLKAAGVSERRNLRRIIRMRDEYESMFSSTIEKGIKTKLFRDEPVGLMTRGVLGALNWMTMWFDPTRTTTAAHKKAMAEKLAIFVTTGLRR